MDTVYSFAVEGHMRIPGELPTAHCRNSFVALSCQSDANADTGYHELDSSNLAFTVSPASAHDHSHFSVSLSSSRSTSMSTDSLVSALSSFPATPGTSISQKQQDNVDACFKFTCDDTHASTGCSGSTSGSEETLIPRTPTYNVPRSLCSRGDSEGEVGESHSKRSQELELDPLFLEAEPASELPYVFTTMLENSDADIQGAKLVDNSETFEDIFNCLEPLQQRSTTVLALGCRQASSERLRALMDDFKTQLSSFRTTARKLVDELEVQLHLKGGGEQTKLEQLLMASLRRAVSQSLEAMVMVSWFRETKMDGLCSLANKGRTPPFGQESTWRPLSTLPEAKKHTADGVCNVEGSCPDSKARHCDSESQIKAEQHIANSNQRYGLNKFGRSSRDHSMARGTATHDEPFGPDRADIDQSVAFLSIQDLSRARCCTPLHFNKITSPSEPSQRRWQAARPIKDHSIATDHTGFANSNAENKCRKSFTCTRTKHTSKVRLNSIKRVPSSHVAGSEVYASASEDKSGTELIQFPSTGSSPPTTPLLPSAPEQDGMVRQLRPSLKSLRNFKLSLRSGAHKDLLLSDTPAINTSRQGPEEQGLRSFHQPTESVGNKMDASANDDRTVVRTSNRPLSLAHSAHLQPLGPVAKLASLAKPLVQSRRIHSDALPRIHNGGGAAGNAGANAAQQGGRNFSLRSLWRAFSA